MEAVRAALQARNPGFDGILAAKIEGDVVTELQFVTHQVEDISPVRALTGLRALRCSGTGETRGQLADLSPLKGMKRTYLKCGGGRMTDLSPLKDMKLTLLDCWGTPVSDLSPLAAKSPTVC